MERIYLMGHYIELAYKRTVSALCSIEHLNLKLPIAVGFLILFRTFVQTFSHLVKKRTKQNTIMYYRNHISRFGTR